jgi:glucan biosynthesis protein C
MTVTQPVVPIRYHYMDAMRSILMMLGIVLHSAQLYNPRTAWVMKAPQVSDFFAGLVAIVSIFRMPVFFMVSGFFCLMTLQKYGSGKFLNVRLRRIVLPMIVVGCTFNLFQTFILSEYKNTPFTLQDYWSGTKWLGHMWFLLYLTLYFMFVAFVASFFYRIKVISALAVWLLDRLEQLPLLLLIFLLGFSGPFIQLLVKFFPFSDDFHGLLYWSDVLYYFQFFLLGIVFYNRKTLLARFTNFPLSATLVICVILGFSKWLLSAGIVVLRGKLGKVIDSYLLNILSLVAGAVCFHLFYRFGNYGSKLFNYLSDAAYSVYLVHHLLVVIIGIAIVKIGFSVWAGYTMLLVSVAVFAIGFHEMVRRFIVLRLLFNGRLSKS